MGSRGDRPRLLFVAPWFLFPNDSGGKIRTTQILRGMKGGAFEIVLASPEPADSSRAHAEELAGICDRYTGWPVTRRGSFFALARIGLLLSKLPIPVATDRSARGRTVVAAELARDPDLVVVDFTHTSVLAPAAFRTKSLLFTHNVEAEILQRHAEQAKGLVGRTVWRNQYRKMVAFEHAALHRFDMVVAVAERDADFFTREYACRKVEVIPTGVDLDYFRYAAPGDEPRLVYVGSMDSMANIEGVRYFMDEIWPLVAAKAPGARMKVVGKNPPASLVKRAQAMGAAWEFTGFVDDVRPHVDGAAVHVVPLRVGGGTCIKVYEGLALGGAMVSTTIGVEGLDLEDGRHYLKADGAKEFAAAVVRLLREKELRESLSRNARAHVEAHYGSQVVADRFEVICLNLIQA